MGERLHASQFISTGAIECEEGGGRLPGPTGTLSWREHLPGPREMF